MWLTTSVFSTLLTRWIWETAHMLVLWMSHPLALEIVITPAGEIEGIQRQFYNQCILWLKGMYSPPQVRNNFLGETGPHRMVYSRTARDSGCWEQAFTLRRSEHRAEHAFQSSSGLHFPFTTTKSEFSMWEALCFVDVGLIELCIYWSAQHFPYPTAAVHILVEWKEKSIWSV